MRKTVTMNFKRLAEIRKHFKDILVYIGDTIYPYPHEEKQMNITHSSTTIDSSDENTILHELMIELESIIVRIDETEITVEPPKIGKMLMKEDSK